MPRNLNASHILSHLSPNEQVALLTFFHDRWSDAVQTDDMGEHCDRLGIDHDALADAAGLIGNHWNGAN